MRKLDPAIGRRPILAGLLTGAAAIYHDLQETGE